MTFIKWDIHIHNLYLTHVNPALCLLNDETSGSFGH